MGELAELLDRGAPRAAAGTALPPVAAAELDALSGRWSDWVGPRDDVHWGVRARALVGSGRPGDARALLRERLATGDRGDGWTAQGLAAAVWAASRVGPHDAPALLDAALHDVERPDGAGFLFDGDVPLAPVAQLRGLLAAAAGDPEGADRELSAATAAADARAPVWGALARLERARVLRADAGAADPALRATLSAARTFFAAAGFHELQARCDALVGPPAVADEALPQLGHLVPGDRWTAGFGVEPAVDVPASKGMVALAHLISARGRAVPALELDHVLSGGSTEELTARLRRLAQDADDPERTVTALLADDAVRSRVTKLLRRTVVGLAERHRSLGEHLQRSVSTGHACRYDAAPEVRWRL